MSKDHRRGRVIALGLLVMLLAVLISACGSNSDSDTATSDLSTAETTESTGGGTDTAGLEDKLAEFEEAPTAIAQQEPMKKSPTGTVSFLECDAQPCVEISEALAAAAKNMGVDYKPIPAGASPETFQAAASQAAKEKPAVLIMASLDGNLITKQIAELKSAGVKTIDFATSKDETDTFDAYYIPPELYTELGIATVWYTMVHSGPDSDLLVINQSIYGSNATFTKGVKEGVETECPECTFSEVDTLPEEVGNQAPGKVVSFLQQDPSIEYQVIPAAGFTSIGVPQAIKAAGIQANIVGGQSGGPNNWEDMQNGEQEMSFEISLPLLAYYSMDAAGRLINGEEPLPDSAITWYQLVQAEDLELDPATDKPVVPIPDYESEFKKVWGK